ncbi:HTH domain-containing protein [Natronococcus wangiae]|uniref:HTH domain-containing protein n=1 Tax=Natronococcus wangiae TaxID=3068275 RepID=UPI003133BE28
MSANKSADTKAQGVGTDLQGDLRVNCYVRSTMPSPLVETVNTVTERLQRLHDQGSITECRISHWPPEHSAVTDAADTEEPTRDELVAEFEQWADQHGYTLEPSFRRQEIPSSPFGLGTDDTRDRIRVPFIALALYEDDTWTDPDTEALRGVVPYTECLHTGVERTYTVDEWLSTVEATGCEGPMSAVQHEQADLREVDQ